MPSRREDPSVFCLVPCLAPPRLLEKIGTDPCYGRERLGMYLEFHLEKEVELRSFYVCIYIVDIPLQKNVKTTKKKCN